MPLNTRLQWVLCVRVLENTAQSEVLRFWTPNHSAKVALKSESTVICDVLDGGISGGTQQPDQYGGQKCCKIRGCGRICV